MASLLKTQSQTYVRHSVRIIAAVVLVGICVAGGGLYAYGRTLQGRIYPGVMVAGLALGGMTAEEATSTLEKEVRTYATQAVSLGIGSTTLRPSLQEIGVTIDIPGTVEHALRVGRLQILPNELALPRLGVTALPLDATIDEKKFQEYLTAVERGFSFVAIEPTLQTQNGAVIVMPGQPGRTVAAPADTRNLIDAIRSKQQWQQQLVVTDVQPTLQERDLDGAKTMLTTIIETPVTIHVAGKDFRITKDQLSAWVDFRYRPSAVQTSVADGYDFVIHEDTFRDFIAAVNEDVGTPAKPTEGYQAEVNGEYAYKKHMGIGVNVEDAGKALMSALRDGKHEVTFTLAPVMPDITYRTITPPETTGKVVEVNLARQELYAFEDGKMKFWTHVSTGIARMPTPPGRWKIYAKVPIQWMIGQGYALPNVKWVMPYNGDYTLHTAYWHTDFGKPKSHGCTNMSEADAKWLYDFVNIGTPVVIVPDA